MRDKHAVSDETEKAFDGFFRFRGALDHFIADTGKLCDFLRNRHFRINKGIEYREDLVIFDEYRADFRDFAAER